jgi:GH18 family chitinase
MRSDTSNVPDQHEWPLFTSIEKVRPKFPKGTIVQVAIGGWGDTSGFSTAARTEESRMLFASNVKAMLDATGADGMLPFMVSHDGGNC